MKENKTEILILGAGSVGSYITYSLVPLMKKGLINVTVCDFDIVDAHNPNNQLYTLDDVGKLKIDALKELIIKRTNQVIETYKEDPSTFGYYNIVINAVDDVKARRRIYETSKEKKCMYIETGTGMDNSWLEVNHDMTSIHDSIEKFLEGKTSEELQEYTACGTRIFDTGMVLRVAGEVVGAIRMFIEEGLEESFRLELFKSGTHLIEHNIVGETGESKETNLNEVVDNLL